MNRRRFIQLSVISAICLLSPLVLSAKKNSKKTLILIELDGGNDGLNTFVPYSSKRYYSLRPNISISKDDLYVINKDFALNKNLKNLYTLYNEGNLAIINGLGYEKANLSHFKSIQIVETAGTGKKYSNEGWISEHLRKYKISEDKPANALLIGKRKRGHLFDKDLIVLQIKNIKDFIKKSEGINFNTKVVSNSNLDFLYKQEKTIVQARKSLKKHIQDFSIEKNENELIVDFKEALKIIKSNLEIPVIKVSHKGYDTHSNQNERQSELLSELDEALGYLVNELKKSDLYNDVLIMTYSEFGRRVKENGSLGTDHGTASMQFVSGGLVKGGLYGKPVNLDDLNKNNLVYTTEYKSLYNTILSKWFMDENNKFSSYEILDFI